LEGSVSGASLEQVNTSFQKDTQFEQPYTPQYLADALSGDNPVFVNMTAAWCITCKVNEKMALSTTRVQNLMATRHITYIKGDWTRYNPDITAYLATFDRQGVPLYVFYGNKDPQTGQRPAPIVLPQILTTDLLIQTFQK
jgi:thiol:disulfide interchange protein